MIRTIFFFTLQTVLLLNRANSQAPPNYTPPTPVAAQFEKYINYPVDHSTGASSVNVPLYNLKAGGIEVPLSLSYHTSGVKPDDPSLPVGLGWTINPGARVTRTIVKYPDEFYPKAPYQSAYDPVTDLQLLQNMEYSPGGFWPSSARNAIWDTEYDIFTYYTGTGVQGRFVIQQQGSEFVAIPLVLSRDKINIHIGYSGLIDYIEITDANGNLYRFGKGLTGYSSDQSSHTYEYSNDDDFSTPSGWMLTDIITANKADTISLIWEQLSNNSLGYLKKNKTDKILVTHELVPWSGTPDLNDYIPFGHHHSDLGGPETQDNHSFTNVFAGIKHKNRELKVIFTDVNYSTVATALEIYSAGIKQRQVDFHTSLFTGNQHRRLDSISIKDKASQLVNRYRFGYNEQVQLPGELSRALDFWNYYNGYETNTTLVPDFPYSVDKYFPQLAYTISTGTNRSSNINASAFILNSITYPTGGKTTYEYENNQINVAGSSTPTGGLRVKKISHWSSDGQLAEARSYVYGIDECGYGDGIPMTANMFVETNKTFIYYMDNMITSQASFSNKNIFGSPVNGMFSYLVPPVSYQQVTEYIGDNVGNNSGKIIYRYTPMPLPRNSTFYAYTAPYTYVDRYWQKPVLLSTTSFKNDLGTYKVVNRRTVDYTDYLVDSLKSWVVQRYAYIKANQDAIAANPLTTYETYYNYYFGFVLPYVFELYPVYLLRGIRVPATERNVDYTPTNDSIVTQKTYGYANNDYLYPKTLTMINSDGTTAITHYTYPKDYNVGSSPTNPVAQGIKLLMDRNVVSPIVEEYTEVQPANIVKSGRFTTFKTDKPVPENSYDLKAVLTPGSFTPATISSSTHTKSASYYLKETISLYDTYGNVREAVDQVGGITTVILYSYNGQLPITIIKNASFSSVAIALGGETAVNNFAAGYPTDAQVNSFLSTLRASLPQAFITTYTHDPFFGVTSQTDENGRPAYFEYDAAGRLQLIKDKDGNIIKTFEYNYKQ